MPSGGQALHRSLSTPEPSLAADARETHGVVWGFFFFFFFLFFFSLLPRTAVDTSCCNVVHICVLALTELIAAIAAVLCLRRFTRLCGSGIGISRPHVLSRAHQIYLRMAYVTMVWST